jgi:hypothetical protein
MGDSGRSAGTRRYERLFIVRMWRESGAPPESVRIRLSDVTGEQQYGFSSVADLAECLHGLLVPGAAATNAESPAPRTE